MPLSADCIFFCILKNIPLSFTPVSVHARSSARYK